MAGSEPSLSDWDSVQQKLKALSEAISSLPEDGKIKAIDGLEDLTSAVKRSLVTCGKEHSGDDCGLQQKVKGLESCSKTKNSRNTEASLTMSEHPVRRSRRQCYVKRSEDYIVEMPGTRTGKLSKKIKLEKEDQIVVTPDESGDNAQSLIQTVKMETDLDTEENEEETCIVVNTFKVEAGGDCSDSTAQRLQAKSPTFESSVSSVVDDQLEISCEQPHEENLEDNGTLDRNSQTLQLADSVKDNSHLQAEAAVKIAEAVGPAKEEKSTSDICEQAKINDKEGKNRCCKSAVRCRKPHTCVHIFLVEAESIKPASKKKRERCLVCRKKCQDKDALREHMQKVHKIKIELKNTQKTTGEGNEQKVNRQPTERVEETTSDLTEDINGPDQSIKLENIQVEHSNLDTECVHMENNQIYQCDVCGKKLSKEIGLKQHMSRYHLKELPTTCDICHKTYDSHKSLLSHRRIVHGGKRFLCDQCNYSTKHSLDLKRHMIRSHGNKEDYPYKCEICHKRFITSTTLKKHSEVHNESRPEQKCSYAGCKFVTRSSMSMTIHLRNKHLGKQRYFDCEICGKRLGAKATYDTHLRRHRGQYIFKCTKCPASFPCRTQLAAHSRVHGDKTEECPVCGKKFNAKAKVQRHMMIHSGEKKYSCPLCVYKCNLDSNLRKHCIARHNIEYPPKRKPVYQLQSADEDERLRQQGVIGSSKATRLSQKVEVMLQGASHGQLDSEELLSVLQSHGFTGSETLQIELGGQTYLINQGDNSGSSAGSNSVNMGQPPPGLVVNNGSLMTSMVNIKQAGTQVAEGLQEEGGGEETGVHYQMTFSDTAVRLTGSSPPKGTEKNKKKGFLKLEPNDVITDDIAGGDEENVLSIVTPDYSSMDISGECVLSENTLQQISSSVDDSNTIIVIQKPDGLDLKPTAIASASDVSVMTTANNDAVDTTMSPVSSIAATAEYFSASDKSQLFSIGKAQEESFGLKSIDVVNHTSEGSCPESVLDYGFVTSAGSNKGENWVAEGLDTVDQVIVSTVDADQPTLVIVGGEQSVL